MTELLIKNILSEILFENRICESLEDHEIINFFYTQLLCEKLLYGQNLTIPELRKLLHQKIIHFEFIKLDGEIRDVPRGTTMMKYIPTPQQPKGIRPSSPKVATFFDLEKHDWRSVSQRSKEIVLKKDEETGKPVVMVKDKPEAGEVAAIKGEEPRETPIEKPEEPIRQPDVTIDGKPLEEPIEKPEVTPEEMPEIEPEVSKVKPVEKTEVTKEFHFKNDKTGASETAELSPKDVIKRLKELGKNWFLQTDEEYKSEEKNLTDLTKQKPNIPKVPTRKTKTVKPPLIKPGEDLENIKAAEL